MKPKVLIVLLLVLMVIPFTSTRSFSELETRYIVLGAAIDYDPDKKLYAVTAEVVSLEDSSTGAVVSKLYYGSGRSVFEAVRNIIKTSGKKLLWAHTKVFIISKDLAAYSIYPTITLINRDYELRNSILIAISKESTAREILECKPSKTSIPSNIISEILEGSKSAPKYPKTDAMDFTYDLATPGIEPIAPAIKIITENGDRKVQVDGTAVFLSDILIGFLDDQESMDLLIVRNIISGGLIHLNESTANLNSYLALEILDNTTKFKPIVEEEKVVIKISVSPRLSLEETGGAIGFSSMDEVEKLEQACNNYLEARITNTIKTVQDKYKSDIFGFGKKTNITLPYYWKELKSNWNSEFHILEFTVNVDADISGSGLISKPIRKE